MPENTKRPGCQPDANSKSGQIRELLKTDMSVGDIAKKLGCTPALAYNVKARAAGGGAKKRGPGRPPKAKATATPSGLDAIAGTFSCKATRRATRRGPANSTTSSGSTTAMRLL